MKIACHAMLLLTTRYANHYYLIRLLSLTIMSSCWVVLLSLFLPDVIISAYNPSTYSSFDRRIRLLPCTVIGTRATIINEFPLLLAYGYRRGEDMWPPTNLEKPVQLKDSFPLGYIIPYPPIIPQEQQIMEDSTTTTSSTSNATATNSFNTEERSAIKRILRRASRLQIKRLTDRIDFTPAFLSVILYLMGLVHRSDGWFVLAFSAYATFLYQWSQQPYENNSSNNRIIMPALPPQGHVPYLVSNPLGRSITDSPIYKLWIRTGWFVGLVLPLSYIAGDLLIFGGRRSLIHASSTGITEVLPTILSSSLRWCGSPIFLLCMQSFSEAVARNVLVPLPLRILITITYNTKRLGSIWDWFRAPIRHSTFGYFGRTLALFNLIYWSLNLFVFLLPVVTMKYLRAHFFCVEASEVTIRNEESIGLC